MDLQRLIPNDDKWILSNNIIYIKYISKIPLLIKRGDDIFIYFDVKIAKYVIKMVKILIDNNINFLFMSTLIFFEHKFSEGDFHSINIRQYIKNICNEKFFDGFKKIDFDFTNNLTNYLKKYNCHNEFSNVYKKQSLYLSGKEYDYWSQIEIYRVKRTDIRDYVLSLEREVKINLIF